MTRPAVELPELPDCAVCEYMGDPPKPATADSVVREFNKWGYTCDDHASWRVGRITPLVKVDG